MMTRRPSPYAWATWLSPTLSGNAQCLYAPWAQANFTFKKIDRSDFNLATWKADHAAMVDQRAVAMHLEGWTVYLEGQNKFTLAGKATTLAGQPDLVGVRPDEVLIVDCKTGQRRSSDVYQVCLYAFALPLAYPHRVTDRSVRGEVQYRDGSIAVPPLTPETRAQILALLARLGDPTPPRKVPSAGECRFCPIGPEDCRERIDQPETVVAVEEF
jgi:hypothetical protein